MFLGLKPEHLKEAYWYMAGCFSDWCEPFISCCTGIQSFWGGQSHRAPVEEHEMELSAGNFFKDPVMFHQAQHRPRRGWWQD
jgi:hypothetical protein